MNNHYNKAVEMLDNMGPDPEPSVERPKPKRRKLAYVTGTLAIILLVILLFFFYNYYGEEMEERDHIISQIKGLNVTIDGAEIEYSYRLKILDNNWTRLDVKVVYPDSPWDNYLAYFWYNTETKENKIVPRD